MDIRRIQLWQSRNATYMSNDIIRTVIEDQGDIALELSAMNIQQGWVNALSIPYYRGRGSGVLSDENQDWYKLRQFTYQAGGIYFTFPSRDEERITAGGSYWLVRRYGSESEFGAVWRLSEMKSREEQARYQISKVDILLPGHPVLYSYARITNLGSLPFDFNCSVHAMLSAPFLESGCLISTSATQYAAFPPNLREVANNRLKSGIKFNDLRHAPGNKDNNVDASYIPGPTGSYDYVMGAMVKGEDLGWTAVLNPRQQLIYLTFFPSMGGAWPEDMIRFPSVDLAMNYNGRMDAPWALFEGGTPQVFSLTTGFGIMNHKGAISSAVNGTIFPGEVRTVVYGNAFTSYDNPRISNGFFSVEKADHGLVCKRTKSYAYIQADYHFSAIRQIAERLLAQKSQV